MLWAYRFTNPLGEGILETMLSYVTDTLQGPVIPETAPPLHDWCCFKKYQLESIYSFATHLCMKDSAAPKMKCFVTFHAVISMCI